MQKNHAGVYYCTLHCIFFSRYMEEKPIIYTSIWAAISYYNYVSYDVAIRKGLMNLLFVINEFY